MADLIVKTVEVTKRVDIREWPMGDGVFKYDWVDSNGGESDELFDTIEEAEEDAGYHD